MGMLNRNHNHKKRKVTIGTSHLWLINTQQKALN